MKEINVKTNNTGLKIEMDGTPDYDKVPDLHKSVIAGKYEKVVFEIFEKYLKRKK